MIEVSGLSKKFGSVRAIEDVTFSVSKGQIVGFLGANGAGKTTTMDILCGCMGADQGSVKIGGADIIDSPIEVKSKIGYLPDEPPLYKDMRVNEYIEFSAKLKRVPATNLKSKVQDITEKLSLGSVRNRLVGQLSKGYRQRVGLAQALVHDPDILILDEPTEGLDPNQIVQIRNLIGSLKGEHTIIFSSHILSEVESISDEIIIIDKGKVIEQGTYSSIANKAESSHCYHIQVQRNLDKLCEDLKTIDQVSEVKIVSNDGPKKNLVELYISNGLENIDPIASKIVDGGYGLINLSKHEKSLEDVFFQLTK